MKSYDLNDGLQHAHRSHKCSQCEFTSNKRNDIRLHKRMHEWNKKHKCPHCSYSSDTKGVVSKHSINYHREIADSQPEVAKKYFLFLFKIIILKFSLRNLWLGPVDVITVMCVIFPQTHPLIFGIMKRLIDGFHNSIVPIVLWRSVLRMNYGPTQSFIEKEHMLLHPKKDGRSLLRLRYYI